MQSIDIDGTQVPLSAASVILTSIKREIPDMFTNAETFFELLALGGDDEGMRDGIIEEFRKDMREALKKYASYHANKSDTSDDFLLLPPPPPQQQLTAMNNNNYHNNSTDFASGFGVNNAQAAFAAGTAATTTTTTTTTTSNNSNSNNSSNVNPNFVDYSGTVPVDPMVRPRADHAITSDLKVLDLNKAGEVGGNGKTATKKAGPKVGGSTSGTIYNGGGGGLVGGGGGGGDFSPIVDGNNGNNGGDHRLKLQAAKPISNVNQNPPSDTPTSAGKWSCPSCTFGNHVDIGECEICSTRRPGSGAPTMSTSPRSSRIIRPGVKLECSICFSTSDEKPVYENPGKCKHQYCHECMVNYLTSKIQSRDNLSTIPCPGAQGCKSLIAFEDVKDFVTTDLFQKYEQFLTEDLIYGNSGAVKGFEQYIHCPTEGCNNVFSWNSSDVGQYFKCDMCTKDYCLRCQIEEDEFDIEVDPMSTKKFKYSPGHSPYSCHQQRTRMEEDKKIKQRFEEWKKLNADADIKFKEMVAKEGLKPCPNCSAVIQRNEGCDHMTCKKCNCSFCYICGKYDKKNPQNRGDCGSSCQTKRGDR